MSTGTYAGHSLPCTLFKIGVTVVHYCVQQKTSVDSPACMYSYLHAYIQLLFSLGHLSEPHSHIFLCEAKIILLSYVLY